MSGASKKAGKLSLDAPTELKLRSLDAMTNLLYLEVSELFTLVIDHFETKIMHTSYYLKTTVLNCQLLPVFPEQSTWKCNIVCNVKLPE